MKGIMEAAMKMHEQNEGWVYEEGEGQYAARRGGRTYRHGPYIRLAGQASSDRRR
jgi:hypothetical protein